MTEPWTASFSDSLLTSSEPSSTPISGPSRMSRVLNWPDRCCICLWICISLRVQVYQPRDVSLEPREAYAVMLRPEDTLQDNYHILKLKPLWGAWADLRAWSPYVYWNGLLYHLSQITDTQNALCNFVTGHPVLLKSAICHCLLFYSRAPIFIKQMLSVYLPLGAFSLPNRKMLWKTIYCRTEVGVLHIFILRPGARLSSQFRETTIHWSTGQVWVIDTRESLRRFSRTMRLLCSSRTTKLWPECLVTKRFSCFSSHSLEDLRLP